MGQTGIGSRTVMTVVLARLCLIGLNAALVCAGLWRLLAAKRSGLLRLAAAALVCEGLLYAYAWHVEPNWIETTVVEIDAPDLAEALQDLTVVQISDWHVNEMGWRERRLPEAVNRLEPDLVLVTGDYISSIVGVKGAVEIVRQLRAPLGVWGVLGNTDHIFVDGPSLTDELRHAGMHVLVNSSAALQTPNGVVYLVGVDDPVTHRDQPNAAWHGVPSGAAAILLGHAPEIVDHPLARRASLALAGHTHGGQLGIALLLRLSEYANRSEYMRGLFVVDGTPLYVNRGIGMKTRMFRFLCRPEITVFQFVGQGKGRLA